MKVSSFFFSAALLLPSAHAWGGEGHGIVATIAHMYLQPNVLPTICDILQESNCHLAPVSTWADKVRRQMPWSAGMHFINPLDDHPPQTCLFPGRRGWDGADHINVLDSVKNTTNVLQQWVSRDASDEAASEALKFLVHFIGDLHQPMHLVARERGGTRMDVRFNGRSTNIHAVWDSSLINKFMAETPAKYSRPSSNRKVEDALTGERYDPYIRRIMQEGVFGAWQREANTWFTCTRTRAEEGFPSPEGQMVMTVGEINPDGPVVCPYNWARPIHALNCEIAWPQALDDDSSGNFELDTPEYSETIGQRMVVEKLLAQAGIRLAGILNHVFADQ